VIVDSTKCLRDEYGIEDQCVIHLIGKPKDLSAISGGLDSRSNSVSDSINETNREADQDNMDDEQFSSSSDNSSIELDDGSIQDAANNSPFLHQAAALGDMDALRAAAISSPHLLYAPDFNGWTPLHEAARAGDDDVITFLMQQAEICGVHGFANSFLNAVSNNGNGWTPLALAVLHHGEDHPAARTLRRLGGQVTYPRR